MINRASLSTTEMAVRLQRRRNAEKRFKLYGQIAIGMAISFLAILLISIGTKSASAFSRYMVDITLERPDFAEKSNFTVTEVNLAVRDKLLELFPETRDDRNARADLFGITTRLAVLPLRASLERAPEQAEFPVQARLALSDDLDLYLKYDMDRHRSTTLGEAGRLSRTETGLYRLSDAGPDGFNTFQDQVQSMGASRDDILVSLSGAWFELLDVSGAVLVLKHLAGPLPPLGEQANSAIDVTYLNSLSTNRKVSNRQIAIALILKETGLVKRRFNSGLFNNADSTYPELAGAAAALLGSIDRKSVV